MVYFSCSTCGEDFKKSAAFNHRLKCRGCKSMSCLDCGKEFRDNEYISHNQCISEQEKYTGKKPPESKGLQKQEQWVEIIRNKMSSNSFPPHLCGKIDTLFQKGNIPRKKNKFENFFRNVFHTNNGLSEVWDILSEAIASAKMKSGVASTTNLRNGDKELNTNGTSSEQNKDDVKNVDGDNCHRETGTGDHVEMSTSVESGTVDGNSKKKKRRPKRKHNKINDEANSNNNITVEEIKGKKSVNGKTAKPDIVAGNTNKSEGKKKLRKKGQPTGLTIPKKKFKSNHQNEVEEITELESKVVLNSERNTAVTQRKKKQQKKGKRSSTTNASTMDTITENDCLFVKEVPGVKVIAATKPKKLKSGAAIKGILKQRDRQLPDKKLKKKVIRKRTAQTDKRLIMKKLKQSC